MESRPVFFFSVLFLFFFCSISFYFGRPNKISHTEHFFCHNSRKLLWDNLRALASLASTGSPQPQCDGSTYTNSINFQVPHSGENSEHTTCEKKAKFTGVLFQDIEREKQLFIQVRQNSDSETRVLGALGRQPTSAIPGGKRFRPLSRQCAQHLLDRVSLVYHLLTCDLVS